MKTTYSDNVNSLNKELFKDHFMQFPFNKPTRIVDFDQVENGHNLMVFAYFCPYTLTIVINYGKYCPVCTLENFHFFEQKIEEN